MVKILTCIFTSRTATYDGVSEWYFEHKLRSHFAKYLLGDFTNTGFYDIKTNEYDQVIK